MARLNREDELTVVKVGSRKTGEERPLAFEDIDEAWEYAEAWAATGKGYWYEMWQVQVIKAGEAEKVMPEPTAKTERMF